LLEEKEEGRLHDRAALEARVRAAVAEVVKKQAECGLAIINDGEQGKVDYTIYVKDRLTGFEGESSPIRISGGVEAEEIFMTSPSPGQIGRFLRNQYYPSDEEYLYRLAEVMRREYRAIVEAGFLLQLDCPDLALGRHTQFAHLSLEEFRKVAAMHVEVLNDAVRDIAPDRMRMHICWASTGGPHLRDVPLKDIVDIVLKGRPHRRLRLRFRDLRRPGAGGLELSSGTSSAPWWRARAWRQTSSGSGSPAGISEARAAGRSLPNQSSGGSPQRPDGQHAGQMPAVVGGSVDIAFGIDQLCCKSPRVLEGPLHQAGSFQHVFHGPEPLRGWAASRGCQESFPAAVALSHQECGDADDGEIPVPPTELLK